MPQVKLPPLAHASAPRAWARAQAAYDRAIADRDRLIIHHHKQGYPVDPDIMAAFKLSKTRVYQILTEEPPR